MFEKIPKRFADSKKVPTFAPVIEKQTVINKK